MLYITLYLGCVNKNINSVNITVNVFKTMHCLSSAHESFSNAFKIYVFILKFVVEMVTCICCRRTILMDNEKHVKRHLLRDEHRVMTTARVQHVFITQRWPKRDGSHLPVGSLPTQPWKNITRSNDYFYFLKTSRWQGSCDQGADLIWICHLTSIPWSHSRN